MRRSFLWSKKNSPAQRIAIILLIAVFSIAGITSCKNKSTDATQSQDSTPIVSEPDSPPVTEPDNPPVSEPGTSIELGGGIGESGGTYKYVTNESGVWAVYEKDGKTSWTQLEEPKSAE